MVMEYIGVLVGIIAIVFTYVLYRRANNHTKTAVTTLTDRMVDIENKSKLIKNGRVENREGVITAVEDKQISDSMSLKVVVSVDKHVHNNEFFKQAI